MANSAVLITEPGVTTPAHAVVPRGATAQHAMSADESTPIVTRLRSQNPTILTYPSQKRVPAITGDIKQTADEGCPAAIRLQLRVDAAAWPKQTGDSGLAPSGRRGGSWPPALDERRHRFV